MLPIIKTQKYSFKLLLLHQGKFIHNDLHFTVLFTQILSAIDTLGNKKKQMVQ
jgi:hypothetical protein